MSAQDPVEIDQTTDSTKRYIQNTIVFNGRYDNR